MKKIWVLVLLISLGLNVGLGLRLLNSGPPAGGGYVRGRGESTHRSQGRWAHRDSADRHRMFNLRMERLADFLDLNPDQRVVFEKVHEETGRLLMRKRELIAERRELLRELVSREVVDQDQIRASIAQLGQQQAVLDSLVAETLLQEMAVLEPAQREQYLEMLSLDGAGRGRSRGRGGRGRFDQ